MKTSLKTIGLFGGTFDPVHVGHIKLALEAKTRLQLDELYLLPCHLPPHKNAPNLDSAQRLHLLQLAISDLNGIKIDDRELQRSEPSYTVDTLKELRQEYGHDVSLALIIGSDAYNQLTQWHHWPELPALANIVVLQRPGYELPQRGVLADWLQESRIEHVHQQPAGAVVVLGNIQMDVSATQIREQLACGQLPQDLALPVQNYILEHQLYGFKERSAT